MPLGLGVSRGAQGLALLIVCLGQGLGKVWQGLAAFTYLVGKGEVLGAAIEKHRRVEQVEQRMSRGREEVMLF